MADNIVTYQSNNSGGYWWLDDEDWRNLEKAGWKVEWMDRFLGAIAYKATKPNSTLKEAVEDWTKITQKNPLEEGCPCCGQPHLFTEKTADGQFVKSGPDFITTGVRPND
jgi:hypothetical protein